jgi:hypothetical protein
MEFKTLRCGGEACDMGLRVKISSLILRKIYIYIYIYIFFFHSVPFETSKDITPFL